MRFSFFTFASLVALVVWSSGCARQIVYPGSLAYEDRVRTFNIHPAQAAKLVEGHSEFLYLAAVIDREYLFSRPEKAWINLEGYYVDGDTGQVQFKSSDKMLQGGLFSLWPSKLPPNPYTGTRQEKPTSRPDTNSLSSTPQVTVHQSQ